MFVQLVGLPGCGKSTLAAALERIEPRVRRVPVTYRRLGTLARTAPARTLPLCLRLAPFASRALLERSEGMTLAARLAPMPTLVNLLLVYERTQTVDGRVELFDEFVYQRILGYLGSFDRLPPARWTRAFVASLRRYEALPIFITADPELALSRAEQRAEGLPRRLAGLSRSGRERVFRNQEAVMGVLMACAGPSIVIAGDREPEDGAREAAEKLAVLGALS
ncbi:MAG: hypothetical protein OXT09_23465 [Myxococcales bacterium]|nr:hypothetical protein [Myxococcales bacterium]